MAEQLPGEDLVRKGLADLAANRDTLEALLVCIGRPRLQGLGIDVPPRACEPSPEMLLYLRLAQELGDEAHGRYNALVRRLVSYERALELERRARSRTTPTD